MAFDDIGSVALVGGVATTCADDAPPGIKINATLSADFSAIAGVTVPYANVVVNGSVVGEEYNGMSLMKAFQGKEVQVEHIGLTLG